MHYIKTVALASLAAVSVSAMPLGNRGLLTRLAEATSLTPLHVSSPVGKNVKRVADDDDGGLWADIADLFLPEMQTGAEGDPKHPPPPPGTIVV